MTAGAPRVSVPPVPAVAVRLRAGRGASDEAFDQVYSPQQQWVSPNHWTPVAVAARAAELLTAGGRQLVLDIGSGVGKFCIVGALTTKAVFAGIEQRPGLVAAARTAAARYGAHQAVFFEGDFTGVDFGCFDAFYLYNPFQEQLRSHIPPIDRTIELSARRFRRHLACLRRKLGEARTGARVLTFCGHGGPLPPGFRVIRSEPAGSDSLLLWQRR
jgi:SAM-dependent methyltransferase